MDPHNKCMGGRMWCVSDICGIICAVMTWLLVTYAEFVVLTVILGTSNHPIYTTFNLLLFNVFAVLALSSHARAMFTDPVSEMMLLRKSLINLKCLNVYVNIYLYICIYLNRCTCVYRYIFV